MYVNVMSIGARSVTAAARANRVEGMVVIVLLIVSTPVSIASKVEKNH